MVISTECAQVCSPSCRGRISRLGWRGKMFSFTASHISAPNAFYWLVKSLVSRFSPHRALRLLPEVSPLRIDHLLLFHTSASRCVCSLTYSWWCSVNNGEKSIWWHVRLQEHSAGVFLSSAPQSVFINHSLFHLETMKESLNMRSFTALW